MTRKARARTKPLAGFQALADLLQFNDQGLMPAVIQDERSQQVLTLCYLNREALEKSLETGTVYVFRRSQHRLMQKGETSGHVQVIREVLLDCEGKSLVLKVRQYIGACHTGYFTCYFRRFKGGKLVTVGKRVFAPSKVYGKSQ
jgi:phosphoribosyl-AMP cyclohydrolase